MILERQKAIALALVLSITLPHSIEAFQINTSRTVNTKRQISAWNRSKCGLDITSKTKHTSPIKVRHAFGVCSATAFDDFEEFFDSNSNSSNNSEASNSSSNLNNINSNTPDSNMSDMYASLRARAAYLSSNSIPTSSLSSEILSNWKEATCFSTVRLSLNDWVRRIDIDTYPLAVCGSANGSLYLADLERGEELDCVSKVHPSQIDDEDTIEKYNTVNEDTLHAGEAMKKLYGIYDGGGIVSIAIHKDTVVSSGREGGLRVFHINGTEKRFYKGSRGGRSSATELALELQGSIPGLDSTIITSTAFDQGGVLWAGGFDGKLRGYDYEDQENDPLVEQSQPLHEMDLGAPILSISVNDSIGCGVVATADGRAVLFSLEDGEVLSNWKPFGKGTGKRKREFARSAIIVQNDAPAIDKEQMALSSQDGITTVAFGSTGKTGKMETVWSVICGGSEGTMYQRRLNVDSSGYISDKRVFLNDESLMGKMRPSHTKAVVSLASPCAGLLVSGSQDGTIRVWDCSYYRTETSAEEDLLLDGETDNDDNDDDEAFYDDVGGIDRRPRCLYALTGYKVWLGSIFTNGKKLVSDGADNTIVVHDFSGEDKNTEGYLFEDDDSEEGFSFE